MKEKRCPYCLSTNVTRKGMNKKQTKRRYKCKNCFKRYVEDGKEYFMDQEKVELINRLLLERLSLRGISRAVKVSLRWLMSYIKKLYAKVPEDLHFKPVIKSKKEKGRCYLRLIKSELDEMWSFVGKRENKRWLWLAQCRETRQIVAFHIGSRGREAARELWKKIPKPLQKYGLFYTDDWDAYQQVLPEERHIISDYKKDTNHVERFNNTLRQRASRLVRKALSFSKSEENHYGAIKYFIAQYNLNLQSKGTAF
jgi:IS1 family transposase/transposase-like protein